MIIHLYGFVEMKKIHVFNEISRIGTFFQMHLRDSCVTNTVTSFSVNGKNFADIFRFRRT